MAERVGAALAPLALEGTELRVTASIGIALAKPGEGTRDGLISDAEAAMFRAKERGRDRYELFDEDIRTRVLDRLPARVASCGGRSGGTSCASSTSRSSRSPTALSWASRP